MTSSIDIPLEYIHTDIPAGMTIRDWRRSRRPPETRSRLARLLRGHAWSSRLRSRVA
jgi:hypothetical protein